MDDKEKVRSELEEFVPEDLDAVFIEAPDETFRIRRYLELFVRLPLFFLGVCLIYLLIQGPLMMRYNRRPRPTEQIVVREVFEDEVPIHGVDDAILAIGEAVGPKTIAANWAGFVLVVVLGFPAGVLATAVFVGWYFLVVSLNTYSRRRDDEAVSVIAGLVVLCAWPLALGLVVYSPYTFVLVFTALAVGVGMIQGTVGERNEEMLSRATAFADEHGYEETVLVTGRDHLRGVASLAPDFSVTVPAVYLPEWGEKGEVRLEFEVESLPGAVGERFAHPEIERDSERSVRSLRIVATLIDAIPLAITWIVVFVGTLFVLAGAPALSTSLAFPATVTASLITVLVYFAGLEARYGTTIGKDLFGLAVRDSDGQRVSGTQALLRAIFRPIDLITGALLFGTPRAQRLGDLVAGTVVGRRVAEDVDWRVHPTAATGTETNAKGTRLKAALVDGLFLFLVVFSLVLYGWLVTTALGIEMAQHPQAHMVSLGLLSVGSMIGYCTLTEWRYGSTPGKQYYHLVVTGTDGSAVTFKQSLIRNTVRGLCSLLYFVPTLIAMFWTQRAQRLGDMAANTVVSRTTDTAESPETTDQKVTNRKEVTASD